MTLKFRLLSIQSKSEAFETGRNMSAMGFFDSSPAKSRVVPYESHLSQDRITFRNALPLAAMHLAPGIYEAFVILHRLSVLVGMLRVERAHHDGGVAEADDLKIAQFDRLSHRRRHHGRDGRVQEFGRIRSPVSLASTTRGLCGGDAIRERLTCAG